MTGFEDGECLEPLFEGLVGVPMQFHASMTQTGTSVAATMTLDHSGAVCTFAGSVDTGILVLALTSCTPPAVTAVSCAGGLSRGLHVNGLVVTALMNDIDALSGSALETDDVVSSATKATVGRLLLRDAIIGCAG